MLTIKKILMSAAGVAISSSVLASPYVELDLGASIPLNSELNDNADVSYKPAIAVTSFYGENLPIHVSYSLNPKGEYVEMKKNYLGRRIPRVVKKTKSL